MLLLRPVRVKWTAVNDVNVPDRSARLPPSLPMSSVTVTHYDSRKIPYIPRKRVILSALILSSALIYDDFLQCLELVDLNSYFVDLHCFCDLFVINVL